MPDPLLDPIEILVCATCRGAPAPAGAPDDAPDDAPDAGAIARVDGAATDDADPPRAGTVLLERLRAAGLPDGVRVRAVECLSNCSRGCTVALRGGAERWTYVYGDLDADTHVDTVLDGARRYRDAPRGLVPWRERSVHFRKHCIARVPPATTADPVS